MTKISELTVADLRGARDQIEAHLKERFGLTFEAGDYVQVSVRSLGINFCAYVGRYNAPERIEIYESAEHDADWTEFMDKVWKRVGQIPSREARELRSVMSKLGDAIEVLAGSPSEFAVTLVARLRAAQAEAGRLLEHQPGE